MVELFSQKGIDMSNKEDPPVTQILELRQQGLSNGQIVQILQRSGYHPGVISSAFLQADSKKGVIPVDMNQNMGNLQNPMAVNNAQVQQGNFQDQNDRHGLSESTVTEKERIEELAEAIIDEKWNELVGKIEKIVEWKERTDSRLDRVEESMTNLKSSFSDLHKGVLGKIGDYDRNITDIGSEIKALEKVFQKILPTFTENVNELTRITKKLKDENPKEY